MIIHHVDTTRCVATFGCIRPSELRRLNPRTNEYDMLIDNGLFCKECIHSGQQIVHFSREPLRNRSEVQHARAVSQHDN